jgi:hypothetical protein
VIVGCHIPIVNDSDSIGHPWVKVSSLETLEDLCQRMTNSGHKPHFIKRILCSGIMKYERMVKNSRLDNSDEEYKPLHQPSGRCRNRLKIKALARENWFKGKEKDNEDKSIPRINFKKDGNASAKPNERKQPSTVMFIPNTKGGLLVSKMKENEEKLAELTGFRISYTEAAGTKLGRVFSLDINKNQPCGRKPDKCSQCNNTQEENLPKCKSRNITYESSCTICNPDKPESQKSSQQEGNDVVVDPSFLEGRYLYRRNEQITGRTCG